MNLQLSLKTKWFEMTKVLIKLEDYRDINEYWIRRLIEPLDEDVTIEEVLYDLINMNKSDRFCFRSFTQNTMTLGYPKKGDNERILELEHKGIEIRTGNIEWGAEPEKLYFVIKHGAILV